jgi:hypothetical protein
MPKATADQEFESNQAKALVAEKPANRLCGEEL